MKRFALLVSTLLVAGCADTAIESGSGTSNLAPAKTQIDVPVLVSFEAGETASLAVPEMHCPFGCYPSVKDTLEAIDGIAGVELVEQEEEGKINDRRVIVTFDGEVDSTVAVAALDDASFPGAKFETAKN